MSNLTYTIHPPGQRPGASARSHAPAHDSHAESLRYENEAMRRQLEALSDEPLLVATVVEVRGAGRDGRMMVSLGPGNAIDVNAIEGAAVGCRVRLNRNTMQAIDRLSDETPTGTIVTALRDTAAGELVEAEVMGMVRGFKSTRAVAKGERVVVDPGLVFVLGSLGLPPAQFAFAQETRVSWDDVGGQAEAKAALREAIELPLSHPELFSAYGKRASRGVLLSGPAGCGKTTLGKAAATAIAKSHGADRAGGFVYVKGPELLASYIGKSEEAIRRLFSAARAYKAASGHPAVVFLDECDALLGSRDAGQHTTLNATIVPQFLSEMDGLDDAAAIVILATNKPDRLDPAVVRDGRVDKRVRVSRPTRDDAQAIARIHLAKRPLAEASPEITIDDAARAIADHIFGHGRAIARYTHPARSLEDVTLHLRHFVSGAMIAAIVENAATGAMLRDVSASKARASGITLDDLTDAVDRAAVSMEHVSHAEALSEIASHGP